MNTTLAQTNSGMNAFLKEVLRVCKLDETPTALQIGLEKLGIIREGETFHDSVEIFGWKRGGAESYICAAALSILAANGSICVRKYICKAVFSFGPSTVYLVEKFSSRYELLAKQDVNVPQIYFAGEGEFIQDYIEYSFKEYICEKGANRDSLDKLIHCVFAVADRLDELQFSPITFVPDLRVSTDGQCFLVDVGEDLGSPKLAEEGSHEAREQATQYLQNHYPLLLTSGGR